MLKQMMICDNCATRSEVDDRAGWLADDEEERHLCDRCFGKLVDMPTDAEPAAATTADPIAPAQIEQWKEIAEIAEEYVVAFEEPPINPERVIWYSEFRKALGYEEPEAKT